MDIAVEALGRPQTFSQCVQSVQDGGKAVMIGLTLSGAKGEIDINHLVRRQVCVLILSALLTGGFHMFSFFFCFSVCVCNCHRKY